MQYEIKGTTYPAVVLRLSNGESVVTEGGAMSWMSDNMKMETSGGGIGKMFGRAFSNESIFQNIYTATGGPGMLACSPKFPGRIEAFEITPGVSNQTRQRSPYCVRISLTWGLHLASK